MSNPPAQEAPPAQGPPSVRQTRQQNRKDVRRTLTFLRAMNGLRESFPQLARIDVMCRILPTFEIVSAPEWEPVKNLLARFRPIYLDSDDSSFRRMVKVLPNHLTVQPNPFPGIEKLFSDN